MINAQYSLVNTAVQKYPAVQADNYQPRNLKEVVSICMGESSMDLLSPESIQAMDFEVKQVTFKEDDVTVFIPKAPIEYIVLGMPRLFLYDKNTERYELNSPGAKLAGTKKVTAARVFLAAIIDGNLVLDNDGKPQVFSLLLKSSKTGLIKKKEPSPGDGTLYSLNVGINKHYKVKGWNAHLVSIKLKAVPEKFTSSVSGDSSMGVMFALDGAATPLSEFNQKAIFDLVQNPDLQADIEDPFKLIGIRNDAISAALPVTDETELYF